MKLKFDSWIVKMGLILSYCILHCSKSVKINGYVAFFMCLSAKYFFPVKSMLSFFVKIICSVLKVMSSV